MRFGFLNNFATQIAAPVAETDTTIELASGADLIAAALQSADAVALTLFTADNQGSETKREVVYVTAAAPPTVTVTRAQEGTVAAVFEPGDGVEGRLTAGVMSNAVQGIGGDNYYSSEGSLALGAGYSEADGTEVDSAIATSPGALALGSGTAAWSYASTALGSTLHAELTSSAATKTTIAGAKASASGATALGAGASASGVLSVAIGAGSEAYGLRATAIAGGTAHGEGATAIGADSNAQGDYSLAAGGAYTDGAGAVGLGAGATANGANSLAVYGSTHADEAIAVGVESAANAPGAVAIGRGAVVNVEGGTAVGRAANVSSPKSSAFGDGAKAQPPGVTAIGAGAGGQSPEVVSVGVGAKALAPYSIAFGCNAEANIPGGMAVNAISYVPATYNQTGEFAGPPPNASRQAAMQVVVATEPLDLTDSAAVTTLTLPTNAMMFVDAFDVVVVGADTPSGSPEIQIGPDESAPADYLAATAISKTVAGGRDTLEPLTRDGMTSLRVSVASAGTGTLSVKLVVRGYVMEI